MGGMEDIEGRWWGRSDTRQDVHIWVINAQFLGPHCGPGDSHTAMREVYRELICIPRQHNTCTTITYQ